MKTTTQQKLGGAKEIFGIDIKVNPELDKYSKIVYFPKKLAMANKMLAKLKHLPITD